MSAKNQATISFQRRFASKMTIPGWRFAYPGYLAITVELRDAAAAQEFQRSQIGKDLGDYNVVTRSCQTHVFEVLRAGGNEVPTGARQFNEYLRAIGAHPLPPRG